MAEVAEGPCSFGRNAECQMAWASLNKHGDFERNVSGATTVPDEDPPTLDIDEEAVEVRMSGIPSDTKPGKKRALRPFDGEVEESLAFLKQIGLLRDEEDLWDIPEGEEEERDRRPPSRTVPLRPEDVPQALRPSEWDFAAALVPSDNTTSEDLDSDDGMPTVDWHNPAALMVTENEDLHPPPPRTGPIIPSHVISELRDFADAWQPLPGDRVVHFNENVSERIFSVHSESSGPPESVYLSYC
mmetsp:Transcript_65/g.194  ORF Transcript_65/g.194 Transcript_65/m.194 type:complete len:243 (-) Transcript_65:35-763(-)